MYACCECCFESNVCLCSPVYAKTGKNNMTFNMKNIIIKNYLCAEFLSGIATPNLDYLMFWKRILSKPECQGNKILKFKDLPQIMWILNFQTRRFQWAFSETVFIYFCSVLTAICLLMALELVSLLWKWLVWGLRLL